jgi:hypothetical protein
MKNKSGINKLIAALKHEQPKPSQCITLDQSRKVNQWATQQRTGGGK